MKRKGFTLFELLIVVAIIGVLATIVLISINGAKEAAKVSKTKAVIQQMAKAAQQYYLENNYYPNDDAWEPLRKYANFTDTAPVDGWGIVLDWNNLCSNGTGGRGTTGDCEADSDKDEGPIGISSNGNKPKYGEIQYGIRSWQSVPGTIWNDK